MLLASTGLRATEALSIRLKDLDIKNSTVKLTIRGEYKKLKLIGMYFWLERLLNKYRYGLIINTENEEFVIITKIMKKMEKRL